GGVFAGSGVVNLVNTIVAKNTASDCSAKVTSSDHSLDGDGSCGVDGLSGVDPRLGPLVDNGGPTTTHALLDGSPAVNAGNPGACPAVDQRFAPRVNGCDLGAFELGGTPPSKAGSGASGQTGVGTGGTGAGNGGGTETGAGGKRAASVSAHGVIA